MDDNKRNNPGRSLIIGSIGAVMGLLLSLVLPRLIGSAATLAVFVTMMLTGMLMLVRPAWFSRSRHSNGDPSDQHP